MVYLERRRSKHKLHERATAHFRLRIFIKVTLSWFSYILAKQNLYPKTEFCSEDTPDHLDHKSAYSDSSSTSPQSVASPHALRSSTTSPIFCKTSTRVQRNDVRCNKYSSLMKSPGCVNLYRKQRESNVGIFREMLNDDSDDSNVSISAQEWDSDRGSEEDAAFLSPITIETIPCEKTLSFRLSNVFSNNETAGKSILENELGSIESEPMVQHELVTNLGYVHKLAHAESCLVHHMKERAGVLPAKHQRISSFPFDHAIKSTSSRRHILQPYLSRIHTSSFYSA